MDKDVETFLAEKSASYKQLHLAVFPRDDSIDIAHRESGQMHGALHLKRVKVLKCTPNPLNEHGEYVIFSYKLHKSRPDFMAGSGVGHAHDRCKNPRRRMNGQTSAAITILAA